MIGLSHTTGYAVQALCCLQNPECNPRLIRDIAECTDIPKPYLAKIVNQLSHQGLVTTKRGYRGGIYLTRSPEDISILEIVEAIEGKAWIGECLLGMESYAAHCICPTNEAWKKIRIQIEQMLRDTKLSDVIECMVQHKVQCAPNASSVSPAGGGGKTCKLPRRSAQSCG